MTDTRARLGGATPDTKRRERILRGPALTIALSLSLLVLFGPMLVAHAALAFEPLSFADDVRVLIFPLFRLEDPALFPGDPIVDYYLASLPLAYRALYEILVPIAGVIAVERALPFVELAVSLYFVGRASHELGGRAAAFGAIGLTLGSSYFSARMAGGLPRGFALPLLAAGSYFLVSGKARALAVTTVLSAGFYPVASVLSGLSLAALLLIPKLDRGDARAWSWKRRLLVLGATASGVALLALPTLVAMRDYGPSITPALFSAYPEAGELGRFDPADRPPFPWFPAASFPYLKLGVVGSGPPLLALTDLRAHATLLLAVLVPLALLGVAVAAWKDVRARRLGVAFGALVLGHGLALLVSPRLFLPERYVAYAVPLLAVISLPSALSLLAERVSRRLPALVALALPFAANAVLLLVISARGVAGAGVTVRVPEWEAAFYAAVGALPKTALVAGFPGGAIDNVPYLSRRSAFVTRETHMPFHTRFTQTLRERTRALVKGYFAASRDELVAFRDRSRVTHLLVERHHLRAPPPYFAPFGPEVNAAFSRGKVAGFEVERVLERTRVAESGGLVLLDLSKL
jgi:hypothetical protein